MQPNDPVFLQQQQAEQVRRQQHERQLLEQQEREWRDHEHERALRESATSEGERAGSRRGEQAAARQARHKSADDDATAAMPDDSATAPSRGKAGSGMGTGSLVIGLALAAALGFVGYRFMGKERQPEVLPEAAPVSRELPQALPGAGLSSPVGAGAAGIAGGDESPALDGPALPQAVAASATEGLPDAATVQAEVSVPAPVASSALPAGDEAVGSAADMAADKAASPQVPTVPASAGTTMATQVPDVAHEQPGRTETAGTGEVDLSASLVALQSRVSALEAQVAQLLARPAGDAGTVQQAQPRVVQPQKRRGHRVARQAQPARRSAASSPAGKRSAQAAMQAELLAVDLWDGRPSVVVGTGLPGDQRIRVLQPGEQFNGVGLQSADAVTGRATFSVGQGQQVTLTVDEGRARP